MGIARKSSRDAAGAGEGGAGKSPGKNSKQEPTAVMRGDDVGDEGPTLLVDAVSESHFTTKSNKATHHKSAKAANTAQKASERSLFSAGIDK